MYCTGVRIRDGGVGGMILSRRSILAWSVESSRSTMERSSTDSAFVDVWSRNQCKRGVTLYSIPKDVSLALTRFQVLVGFKKGDPNNGWMGARGAM